MLRLMVLSVLFVSAALANSESPTNVEIKINCTPTNLLEDYKLVTKIYQTLKPPQNKDKDWIKNNTDASHCSLQWSRVDPKTGAAEVNCTELRSYNPPAEAGYTPLDRVGSGNFPAMGLISKMRDLGGIAKKFFPEGRYGIFLKDSACVTGKDTISVTSVVKDSSLMDCLRDQAMLYGRGDEAGKRIDSVGKAQASKNLGRGGPAYEPDVNSNTYLSYILDRCGASREESFATASAAMASSKQTLPGWQSVPRFPFSADSDSFEYDSAPPPKSHLSDAEYLKNMRERFKYRYKKASVVSEEKKRKRVTH